MCAGPNRNNPKRAKSKYKCGYMAVVGNAMGFNDAVSVFKRDG